MTLDEIRARRAELETKARELNRQLDHIRLDFKHLQLECDHPNKFRTSCMGESGEKCPDCGWSI